MPKNTQEANDFDTTSVGQNLPDDLRHPDDAKLDRRRGSQHRSPLRSRQVSPRGHVWHRTATRTSC
eukprot:4324403-Heterocapsa_arctica.AAC.1